MSLLRQISNFFNSLCYAVFLKRKGRKERSLNYSCKMAERKTLSNLPSVSNLLPYLRYLSDITSCPFPLILVNQWIAIFRCRKQGHEINLQVSRRVLDYYKVRVVIAIHFLLDAFDEFPLPI